MRQTGTNSGLLGSGQTGVGQTGAGRLFGGLLSLSLLGGLSTALAQATYSGPQAVVYIGDSWCSGGYCGYSVWSSFDSAMTQALSASGYVRAVRKPEGAGLVMKAGINDVSGGGGICLPIIGCVSAKTVRANLELDDARSGAVIWRDTCEGTSTGYSSWYWWSGVTFDSDEGKAAADCAGKLVQKFNASAALKPYLTVAAGAPLGTAAPVPAPAAAAAVSSSTGTGQASIGQVNAEQAINLVKLLGGALGALSFDDVNALFGSDPLSALSLKAMNTAATQETLKAAGSLTFTATAGDEKGGYRLVNLTYSLPGGGSGSTQLAVAPAGPLNARTGLRLVYLSAFNPARTGTPGADSLSKNVETLLAEVRKALQLP